MSEISISEILTHLGEERSQYYNAIAPPIIQTSNFAFDSPESFVDHITNEFDHHVYTRGNNPTVAILRKKIAALENAEDALVVSSGASAISIAITSQLSKGDHIICVAKPYDWTYKLIINILSRFGVDYDFVDGSNFDNIEKARKANTKVLMLESPLSKTFEVQDLSRCAEFCEKHGIVSIIDNSHCSPIFQKPLDFGIDLVVHSATKYLNGHSDVVVGAICGSMDKIRSIFDREFMTFGTVISPLDAAMVLRGLRTLDLRIRRSNETAFRLAEFLQLHPKVKRVYHTFLPNHPQKELVTKQMSGNGGLFSVLLNTYDPNRISAFCKRLKFFILGVSWGGYESLYVPYYPFHISGKKDHSLPINFIRFYIGLEEFELLRNDLAEALEAI